MSITETTIPAGTWSVDKVHSSVGFAVEKIVVQVRQQGHGLRALVHAVVQSELFLNK